MQQTSCRMNGDALLAQRWYRRLALTHLAVTEPMRARHARTHLDPSACLNACWAYESNLRNSDKRIKGGHSLAADCEVDPSSPSGLRTSLLGCR